MIEEYLFFRQYHFHKQKLAFHRASMTCYAGALMKEGYRVEYIDSQADRSDIRNLIPFLSSQGFNSFHYADTADDWLESRIKKQAVNCHCTLTVYDSPGFLLNQQALDQYQPNPSGYLQANFYSWQRKRMNILLDQAGKPLGGKWSFDADNRKAYPKNKRPPSFAVPEPSAGTKKALQEIAGQYPDNPGSLNNFIYPVNHQEAREWMNDFFTHRFADFGAYEDAIVSGEQLLHHSLLSPLLNCGLLTPDEVTREALACAEKQEIPLSSLEGFIRQVIGWREFVRLIYLRKGREQRTKNFWGFSRKMPASCWTGTTGIPPVDITIKKILATGYCHHIERLMVLGNFFLLCEFDPDDVYRWFMEMFIDAYDWVMVPNVYGMSQFADGGIMCTKPYISGSSYLRKMSDFPAGDWQQTWDALFWRFMHVHRDFFGRNPRLGMLLKTFDKMPDEKRNHLTESANKFLSSL